MSAGIENHIDWTVPSNPHNDRLRPSLARKAPPAPAAKPPLTRRAVLEKLLGDHDLAAFEGGGNDPYNATGRQFRR